VLTQLATVKKRVGVADADVTNDAQLTLLIAAGGERFARETGRKLARTVGFHQESCACCERIGLELYPVGAVTKLEVKCTEAQGWIEVPLTEILVVRSCIVDMRSRLGSTREIGRSEAVRAIWLVNGVSRPFSAPKQAKKAHYLTGEHRGGAGVSVFRWAVFRWDGVGGQLGEPALPLEG
jgi:hypothetical protein